MQQDKHALGPIDPDRPYKGPEVDWRFSINATTRWRWTKRGLLNPVDVAGIPRYCGSELIAIQKERPEAVSHNPSGA